MSPIESLISRFVDDVLRLIREAKVEDLLDLVAAEPRPIPPLEDSEPVLPAAVDDEDDADPPPEEPPATRVTPVSRVGRRRAPSRSTVEEITDPASLLAIAPDSTSSVGSSSFTLPQPPPTLPALLADPVDDIEPPPSSNTESRVLVRLNSNETLARASNAGIVIRRRKV